MVIVAYLVGAFSIGHNFFDLHNKIVAQDRGATKTSHNFTAKLWPELADP